LLEAITEAYVADWTNLDDSDGEASGFFQDLGPIWTEALLSVDLSSRERKVWASKLETWQREIDDYGVEEVFEAAHEAALRGWDDPQLQHVLQGTDIENDSWDGEVSEVTVARLHILERRGRLQEYLHLARAQGRNEAATMGEETRALTAAEVAFREELSLANYLRVAEIAGEQWPERRANLLEYVRHTKSYVPRGQVDVFLHEGLIDDAIAAVEPKA